MIKQGLLIAALFAGVAASAVAQDEQPTMDSSVSWQNSSDTTPDDAGDSDPGWAEGDFRFRTSVYTKHFNPNPDHQNHQKLINPEYVRQDGWLVGVAFFRNSFDQPSEYLYFGKEWTLWQPHPDWRLRGTLTGGLLHGYHGKYKDKIPLNDLGVAPAILPSLGLEYKSVFAEAFLFGTAGVMATVGFSYSFEE